MGGGKISLHGYKACLQFSEIGKAEGHVDWRQNRFRVVAPHTTRYHLQFTYKHRSNCGQIAFNNFFKVLRLYAALFNLLFFCSLN